jgi:indolepyruvate ferredoxin oxidoreductase alpha subunit
MYAERETSRRPGLPHLGRESPGAPVTSGTPEACHELAVALASHFALVLAVPGFPISHLAEIMCVSVPSAVWAVSEKSAVEEAFGASLAGVPACVILKHNGLALALDSLANCALHTSGAPLVVVVGDDPSASASTTAVDSRALAAAVDVPVLEPTLEGDVCAVVATATAISRDCRTPVIIRVTGAMHRHCTDAGKLARVPAAHAVLPANAVASRTAHELTKLGRVQYRRLVTMPGVRRSLTRSLSQRRCVAEGASAVVRLGAAAGPVDVAPWCEWRTAQAWPPPDELLAFAARHREVLVVEDSAPLIERMLLQELKGEVAILGRCSGHLPPEGMLSPMHIADVIRGAGPRVWATADTKQGSGGATTNYGALFDAVAEVSRQGAFVAADVGSAVRLCYPPYVAADAALALGSAISVACGATHGGRRAVAVVGDYALLHSGIQGIVEVVARELPVLVVVLANSTQQKTGGQPVPAIDIAAVIEGTGMRISWRGQAGRETTRELVGILSALLDHLPGAALVHPSPAITPAAGSAGAQTRLQ